MMTDRTLPQGATSVAGYSVDEHEKEGAGARLMRIATYCALGVGVTLIVAKLVAWFFTGSIALLSTLVDSTLDAVASLVNVLAVRHALRPADREHRFGHGKAEALAGLGQSAFIAGSSLFLIGEAAQRLRAPPAVTNGDIGLAVMAGSIVLTVMLVAFQRYVLRRARSLAVDADRLHYTGDLMMNVSVIVSLVLSDRFGWAYADPLFAVGIAVFLLWSGGKVGWEAYKVLMDHELPEPDRDRIKGICLAYPEVAGVHDLRTRSSGVHDFIQLHLELDGDMTLRQAHAVNDAVEAGIRGTFPAADVIVHSEPSDLSEAKPDLD